MNIPDFVQHESLKQWVADAAEMVKPDQVVWCDGSQEEYDRMCQALEDAGTFIRLNPELRPNSFLARLACSSDRRSGGSRMVSTT